jgi:(2Fe-2S) ferredoxin
LVGELERLLAAVGLSGEVEIIATSCRNRCEIGPSVNVYPGPYFYREVSLTVLERIVREHLLADQPVSEFLVESDPPRIDLSNLTFNF